MKRFLILICMLFLFGCNIEVDTEENAKLDINITDFTIFTAGEYKYLAVDINLESNEKVDMKYYFKLETPIGASHDESLLYTNENACRLVEEIDGVVNCKAVYRIVDPGEYTFKVFEKNGFNPILISSITFNIDENDNITIKD